MEPIVWTWAWDMGRGPGVSREAEARAPASRSTTLARNLVEETDDRAQPAAVQHGDVASLDRRVRARGAEAPGEADIVAVAVGLSLQGEGEAGEAIVDRSDHGADLIQALALLEWIDVGRVRRPGVGEEPLAPLRAGLVPDGDVALGDVGGVGHGGLSV